MLKFECPIKARSWAGEEGDRDGLGRPGNMKMNMRKWGRACKERRERVVRRGRLHKERMALTLTTGPALLALCWGKSGLC